MSCTKPRREALSSRLRADDRGSASVVHLIMLGIVLFAILATIQTAFVLHGRNVATAAARDGLHAAQLIGASEGNGVEAAERTLGLFDGIESYEIAISPVTADTKEVTVKITGDVKVPIAGLFNSFNVTVTGPTERFLLETERQ